MLTVQPSSSVRPFIIGFIAFIFTVLTIGFVVGMHVLKVNAAGPVTILVTTTADEDANPGTGCSIYEATVAANTGAAYGGCTAGSLADGSIISVPAGTYALDVVSNDSTAHHTMTLNNASLVGAGSASTHLEAYWFDLTGDSAASLSGISMSNVTGDTDHNPSLYVYVNGSNKTVNDILTSPDLIGGAPADIVLAQDSGTVSNIVLSNISQEGAAVSSISCGGTCSDVQISNYQAASEYNTKIDLGGSDGITVENSSVTATGTANIEVGTNSTLTNVAAHVTSTGTSDIVTAAGSVINGVVQDITAASGVLTVTGVADSVRNVSQNAPEVSGNGVGVKLTATTPLIQGYTAVGNYIELTNSYAGSELSGVDLGSFGNSITVNTKSNNLYDFAATTDVDGSISFTNNQNDASIHNVSLSSLNVTSGGIFSTITGNNNVYDGMNIHAAYPAGSVAFTGANPTFTNSQFYKAPLSMTLSSPGPVTIDNVSIDGAANGFALQIVGAPFTTATISDSTIKNSTMGMNISGGDTLNILNTNIADVGYSGAPGAIYTSAVDKVNIDTVMVARALAQTPGAIFLNGGTAHTIKNTTIFNSNGGIAIAADGSALTADINNVTVVNDIDATDYSVNTTESALYGSAFGGDTTTINVSNSIFAGAGTYVNCVVSGDATIAVDHSLATGASCVSAGFTAADDQSTLIATSPADNSSVNNLTGYNGSDGVVQTLALLSGSQAIGFGDQSTCEAKDARGMVRSSLVLCDVGAYQYTQPVVVTTPDSGNGSSSGSSATSANDLPISNSITISSLTGDDATSDTTVPDTGTTTPETNQNSKDSDANESASSFSPLAIGGIVIGGAVVIFTIAGILIRVARPKF